MRYLFPYMLECIACLAIAIGMIVLGSFMLQDAAGIQEPTLGKLVGSFLYFFGWVFAVGAVLTASVSAYRWYSRD